MGNKLSASASLKTDRISSRVSVSFSFPLPPSGTDRLVAACPSYVAPEQGPEYGGNSEEHRVARARLEEELISLDAR